MAWLFHVSEGELLTTNISEVADQPLQSDAEASRLKLTE